MRRPMRRPMRARSPAMTELSMPVANFDELTPYAVAHVPAPPAAHHVRGCVGHVPRGARRHDRRDRAPHRHRRPRWHRPLRLGVHRVPARGDRDHPAVGPSRRHLRPEEDLPGRPADLPARIGAVRHVELDDAARAVPRHAGHRRRVPPSGVADDRRRHLHAQAASPDLGDLLGRCSASRRSSARCSADSSPSSCRGAGCST